MSFTGHHKPGEFFCRELSIYIGKCKLDDHDCWQFWIQLWGLEEHRVPEIYSIDKLVSNRNCFVMAHFDRKVLQWRPILDKGVLSHENAVRCVLSHQTLKASSETNKSLNFTVSSTYKKAKYSWRGVNMSIGWDALADMFIRNRGHLYDTTKLQYQKSTAALERPTFSRNNPRLKSIQNEL